MIRAGTVSTVGDADDVGSDGVDHADSDHGDNDKMVTVVSVIICSAVYLNSTCVIIIIIF